jgi:hypothetical protein
MVDVARAPAAAERAFVTEVLRGLAALTVDEPAEWCRSEDDLSVPLGMSAWIVRAAVDLPDAYDVLLSVRAAVVEAGGLDHRCEPVPLRVHDPRVALKSLSAYLYELVGRAARHAGVDPPELAERTLALLTAC